MSKRVAPPVKASTPTKRKLSAAAAAVGSVRKSGVVVAPVKHAAKARAVRSRISAINVSKQRQGWGS